jgi:hypothetical protein
VRGYETFLNAWAAIPAVVVGARNGIAYATLSAETNCPYVGVPHKCPRPAVCLSVDDAFRRADAVCRKCRVKVPIKIDDTPFETTL